MVQGLDILKKLVEQNNLVENLSERELKNPENAGFDLRLGEVYKMKGDAFIGIEERKTPDTELVARFEENVKKTVVIKPGEHFIGKTIERLRMPEDLFGMAVLRSTYWRCGINLVSGYIGPGYNGEILLPLTNLGNSNVEIELGARAIHVFFFKIKGKSSKYKGQWQGGRVSASKKEKQI